MTDIKTCPFCNTDMNVMSQRIWHPPNFGCILDSFSFIDNEINIQMWNKRVEEYRGDEI